MKDSLLIGLRAGLIQQKKALQEQVRAVGMIIETVENEIITVEVEALRDMKMGAVLAFDLSGKYIVVANPETNSDLFIGILLRDVRAGMMLIYNPRKNTQDIAIRDSAVGIALDAKTMEIKYPR